MWLSDLLQISLQECSGRGTTGLGQHCCADDQIADGHSKVAAWLLSKQPFGVVQHSSFHPASRLLSAAVAAAFVCVGQLTDPFLQVFRGIIPPLGGIDLSPMLGFFLLNFLRNLLMNWAM